MAVFRLSNSILDHVKFLAWLFLCSELSEPRSNTNDNNHHYVQWETKTASYCVSMIFLNF